METLISTFNINFTLFLGQLINFALVFAILFFLVFKPLLKVMTERTATVEKSLQDADAIKKQLASTAAEQEVIIAQAKNQANAIVAEADKRGAAKKDELIAKAKEEIGQIINNERAKLDREKTETLKEIKKEIADLVIITVEKVLEEKMDNNKDRELIKKMLK